MKNRKPFSAFFKVSIFLILIGGGLFLYGNHLLKTPVDETDNTTMSFDIKQGAPIKDIAKKLKENGLISNSSLFYFYTKYNNLDKNILSGRFELTKSENIPQIIETLSKPPKLSIITIPEGLSVKEIDKKLSSAKIIQPGDLISAVNNFNGYNYYPFLTDRQVIEGFLYPDTYFFDPVTFKAQDFIYKSMDNFETKLNKVVPETSPDTIFESIKKSGRSLNEILIMASIIEKEVFGTEDRKIVSGILWKRLDNNWFLGADATLLYEDEDRIITKADLEKDSPYNTRNKIGLTPGPIGNPSLDSILAALFPQDSEYWFYLNTLDTGETIYAKTNEEHNLNRAKYL